MTYLEGGAHLAALRRRRPRQAVGVIAGELQEALEAR